MVLGCFIYIEHTPLKKGVATFSIMNTQHNQVFGFKYSFAKAVYTLLFQTPRSLKIDLSNQTSALSVT